MKPKLFKETLSEFVLYVNVIGGERVERTPLN